MAGREIRTAHERWLGYLRVLEAWDPKTTHDRLRELAHDVIRPVRLWTARNPNTPPDALTILSTDPDETVRWNFLLNRSTPLEARHLAKKTNRDAVDRRVGLGQVPLLTASGPRPLLPRCRQSGLDHGTA
ncbi:hypothetical protein Vau01_123280 [Virgisporangium aurantiacum]|uniref:Uncharacterized protein n=1 Tax=Virgisporangium aurantiacum TaxID=175570 RepID=A0A8J4EAI5_9ACTN|nr:hypothetical protein Vau01_123280 [Virgisporangium aurantiacum]